MYKMRVNSINFGNRLQYNVGPLPPIGKDRFFRKIENFYENETGVAPSDYGSVSYVKVHGTNSIVLSIAPDLVDPIVFEQRLCDLVRRFSIQDEKKVEQ